MLREKVASLRLLKYRYYCIGLSVLLLVATCVVWIQRGDSKYSIDFAGGSELVVSFEKAASLAELRHLLAENGYPNAIIQGFGAQGALGTGLKEVSIKLRELNEGKDTGGIKQILKEKWDDKLTVQREEVVGPVIGAKVKKDGIYAFIFSLIAVLIYIAFRFQMRFSVGAVVALVHDGVIATGIFLMCGGELSAQVLAAVLTICGYSLTDTIVIYDRVRENLLLAKSGKGKAGDETLFDLTDRSITQTLSRTMLTSMLAFIVVFTLWLLGGEGLRDLGLTLSVGVIVGTYSTIYIACPLMVWLAGGRRKLSELN